MTTKNLERNESVFTSPSVYCIKVQGAINESFTGYFSGMQISTEDKAGSKPVTTLIGELKDQSALVGVFSALYCLHLIIFAFILDYAPDLRVIGGIGSILLIFMIRVAAIEKNLSVPAWLLSNAKQ